MGSLITSMISQAHIPSTVPIHSSCRYKLIIHLLKTVINGKISRSGSLLIQNQSQHLALLIAVVNWTRFILQEQELRQIIILSVITHGHSPCRQLLPDNW